MLSAWDEYKKAASEGRWSDAQYMLDIINQFDAYSMTDPFGTSDPGMSVSNNQGFMGEVNNWLSGVREWIPDFSNFVLNLPSFDEIAKSLDPAQAVINAAEATQNTISNFFSEWFVRLFITMLGVLLIVVSILSMTQKGIKISPNVAADTE